MLCEIFKSKKKEETYLFVEKETVLDELPQTLRDLLGELSLIMELDISEKRKLAREKPEVVLLNIRSQGFHLQLPPKI